MKLRNAQGILSSDIPTGNLLWVDQVNGNDALAKRGRLTVPFKTLLAAKGAAISGDTVVVMPGTYDENNLAKNGVNWHLDWGASKFLSKQVLIGVLATSTIRSPPTAASRRSWAISNRACSQ